MSNEAVAMPRKTRGPWAVAFAKLATDRAAMASLAVFLLIVFACLSAP
ncbi:ABC transporter permease, partial [Mesorhizobium sp. M2D.F.Ca.ET.145.01.1.1]